MSQQEKQDLKEKGKKFVDENLGQLKGAFGKKGSNQQAGGSFDQNTYNQG